MPKREAPSKPSPEPYVPEGADGAGYALCPICANVVDHASADRVYIHCVASDADVVRLVCCDHSWRAIAARYPGAFARETPLG